MNRRALDKAIEEIEALGRKYREEAKRRRESGEPPKLVRLSYEGEANLAKGAPRFKG